MAYGIIDFLKLIGSLGVFLYGMKLMSEALQKVAGDKMRNILAAMTSRRFLGVFTGLLITAVIQSSSATSVMVVSFVNAGLLNLTQSAGVILGANIGTTVTAWIISIFGFKVNISALSLPLIGIGFPLIFSKNTLRTAWGELIIGFALLFLGLEYLKSSVPNIQEHQDILGFLSGFSGSGLPSTLLFLFIGTILTIAIQSSSATIALTLVMCNSGWISFDLAAAMILGENIGTTVTANIAAAVVNKTAKQTARIHFLANVFGVLWMLAIFKPYLGTIDRLMVAWGGGSPFSNVGSIPIALSIFHSSFNILNVSILIWLIPFLTKISKHLVRHDSDEEEFHLKYINIGMISTSELGLLQAKKEIELYGQRVQKMFDRFKKFFPDQKENKFEKTWRKIEEYENANDQTEVEIAKYLTKLSESELSRLSSNRVQSMFTIISEIESVSDCIYNLSKTMIRKRKKRITFSENLTENLLHMFSLIDTAFVIMNRNLETEVKEVDKIAADEIEESINQWRNTLRKQHLKSVEKNEYSYLTGIIYNDLFSECEKLGDYIINVTEAIDSI